MRKICAMIRKKSLEVIGLELWRIHYRSWAPFASFFFHTTKFPSHKGCTHFYTRQQNWNPNGIKWNYHRLILFNCVVIREHQINIRLYEVLYKLNLGQQIKSLGKIDRVIDLSISMDRLCSYDKKKNHKTTHWFRPGSIIVLHSSLETYLCYMKSCVRHFHY